MVSALRRLLQFALQIPNLLVMFLLYALQTLSELRDFVPQRIPFLGYCIETRVRV
jgi:hypothetical protein